MVFNPHFAAQRLVFDRGVPNGYYGSSLPQFLTRTISMRLSRYLLPCIVFLRQPFPADGADVITLKQSFSTVLRTPTDQSRAFRLRSGQTVEINVRVAKPRNLPDNGRLRVRWSVLDSDDVTQQTLPAATDGHQSEHEQPGRDSNAFGIYTEPNAEWSKLLHALDADVYLNYRAPHTGIYQLNIAPEEGDVDLFEGTRWREPGQAPEITAVPVAVSWPESANVETIVSVKPIDVSGQAKNRLYIEVEPNDTPEQAQTITLCQTTDGYTVNVVGSSDDIEYFDNGHVGSSGDDWIRLEFRGSEPRLLTACLSIPDQQVAARIRAYRLEKRNSASLLLPIVEYTDGKNENERNHQQQEQHRTAINRSLEPGETYFLRVEANAPGYDLELRVVQPAPYDNPRRAVVQGLYDHIGQVDAWLTNRPRGASVERRIRDSGNLLGTNCMSCHTQSGVWGPAIPFVMGYRPQNVQPWRHLINTCYQSLRPTNELKEAANNTSLQPLDTGDGPAGTRVAGHAVVSLECFMPARKLQSKQARRTANYILQTSDPGGINAAGPGANVGQGVVFNYAGEIVWTVWQTTGEQKFFHAVEDKARRMLGINVKFCDDLGHRIEFFSRYFPRDYVAAATMVAEQEQLDDAKQQETIRQAQELHVRICSQVTADLQRLRCIQLAGGGWSFDPGSTSDEGRTWIVKDTKADPSPTSLALIAFHAAGVGRDDPTVKSGIDALLKLQKPTGMWKVASQTGFVSTSYALHALSRYFPTEPPTYAKDQFQPHDGESLTATIRRVRDIALAQDILFIDELIIAASHDIALVRFWALLGLGYLSDDKCVVRLVHCLGDPSKMVREAAHWSLRQNLIDDRGWDSTFTALSADDDYTREAAMRALIMKVDTELPGSVVDYDRLITAFDHSLNEDPHPGVRAWATRAAWQWWVWNPSVRDGINTAWKKLLSRDEKNVLTENAIRYQTHALFIANGHIANGSKQHQYRELEKLFGDLHTLWKNAGESDRHLQDLLSRRLSGVASTFYSQRGGDGGPGQLGYSTPGSGSLFGEISLARIADVESLPEGDRRNLLLRGALEGAANIPHEKLQEKLVDYSINGPERFRSLAASSISDPRLVSLVAVPEQLEPMYRQLLRGADESPRRKDLSDPILKMYGSVHWILPTSDEQREEILQFLIPKLVAYRTVEQLKEMGDVAVRGQAERDSEAAWYLADGLGAAVTTNPDLHFEHVAEVFPEEFENHAQARFWMRNVPWILEFKRDLPVVQVDPKKLPPVDPYEELRTRALQLFLTQLSEEADPRNLREAVNLANKTAMRRNPEVLTALAEIMKFEKDKDVVKNANKVLSQSRDTFLKDLVTALKKQPGHSFAVKDGNPHPPQNFIDDITYFRDYVVPEMTKVLRGDERSCMICHGEPGRVPSMELHAPDQVGYLPVDQLLANYRVLQQRVNVNAMEQSKLLRKPLNVQTGREDGHQGGRRYQVTDPGYLILKRWVVSQQKIQEEYGRPSAFVINRE